MTTHVWVYQRVSRCLATPVMGRLVAYGGGGRCVVNVQGHDFAVNRGACSADPFDPFEDKRYRDAPDVRKPKFYDPIFSAPVRRGFPKKAVKCDKGGTGVVTGVRKRDAGIRVAKARKTR